MDGGRAGGVVLPNQIRDTVAVEIGDSDNAPSGRAHLIEPSRALVGSSAVTAVIMHTDGARGVILPNQIGVTVAIEIGRASHMPAGQTGLIQPIPTQIRDSAGPAVIVDSNLASDIVLPHEIGMTVLVEIGDCDNVPARGSSLIDPSPALLYGSTGAPIIVQAHLARDVVLPNEIGHAIVIEVRGYDQRQYTDAFISGIGNIKIAGGVHCDSSRGAKLRGRSGSAISREPAGSRAGHRRDDASHAHLADTIVAGIGDVKIASGIRREALGARELRVGRGAAISLKAGGSIAGHGSDDTRHVDFQNSGLCGIGDID